MLQYETLVLYVLFYCKAHSFTGYQPAAHSLQSCVHQCSQLWKSKRKKRLNSAQMSSTPLPFQQVALFIQLIPYAVIVAACISSEWSLVFW